MAESQEHEGEENKFSVKEVELPSGGVLRIDGRLAEDQRVKQDNEIYYILYPNDSDPKSKNKGTIQYIGSDTPDAHALLNELSEMNDTLPENSYGPVWGGVATFKSGRLKFIRASTTYKAEEVDKEIQEAFFKDLEARYPEFVNK